MGQYSTPPQLIAMHKQESALAPTVSNLKFAKVAIQLPSEQYLYKLSNVDLSCPFVEEVDKYHKKNDD